MLAKKYRLPLPTHFTKTHSIGTLLFTVKIARNTLPYSRFGFIINKHTAPLAVDRNRIKRIYRAIIQENITSFPSGNDYLFIITKKSNSISHGELNSAIMATLEKIKSI